MFIDDKNKLRILYKSIRNSIDSQLKSELDLKIFTRFINSDRYINADLILSYVSFGSEADTRCILEYSIKIGKRVAVPVCRGSEMCFYELKSMDELTAGRFGIPAVKVDNNKLIDNFDNALCIAPGLCFDLSGNRLGYGGGFYDRFLSENKVETVALTYQRCICQHIPTDDFDQKINAVLTENYISETLHKEVSTYE